MATCFISHATADRLFVETEIIGLLRALDVNSWFAKDDIETTEDWERSILSGLQSSDWFIVVISSASVSSRWVKDEVAWAMQHRTGQIIPIVIADCESEQLHFRLPNIQQIDFHRQPNEARQKLVRMIVDIEYNPIRAAAIVGNWRGVISQDPGKLYPDGCEYPVNVELHIQRRSVEGRFDIDLPYQGDTIHLVFSVTGGFHRERFVQLNYLSKDQGAVQFGSVITVLSDSGKKMLGKFVGHGAQSEEIVTGRVALEKVSE